ncbi:CHAT domain-containing protein [Streptomyces sp. NPDC127110]|uniref:CHAT domain-containing protein n=1 Tax=Streptomyces sp. NPDC127110 TaxID=3345362 RepID=UPI00363C33BE
MIKVLTLFANPRGTSQLRLGEEDRTIRECFRRGRYRDQIELTVRHATTVDDVRRALLDDDYTVVHFSGHGTHTGLAFEDQNGSIYVPPRDAFAELLAEYSPPLRCVVLNSCYSAHQGGFVSMGLPYTVAMEAPISDRSAIAFSEAFYDSLAANKEIDFCYRQGVYALRLGKHADSTVPILLRLGEQWEPPAAEDRKPTPAVAQQMPRTHHQSTVIGVGLDVSGSMETNFDNRSVDTRSRLDAVRSALGNSFSTRSLRAAGGPVEPQQEIAVFGYVFGLRDGAVCDLLSLLKAAKELTDRRAAESQTQEWQSSFKQLGNVARDSGFGSFFDIIEARVRGAATAGMAGKLREATEQLGDTTLTLHDFEGEWQEGSLRLSDAEPLIYGATPMREAMRLIKDRFAREISRLTGPEKSAVLLLISDGESTDGDPRPFAEEMKEMGVTIVACYLTASDVASPRHLVSEAAPSWPAGASLLFDMASRLDPDSPICRYLVRQGWRADRDAGCFVQVNHSVVLNEFVSAVTSRTTEGSAALPKGW